MTIVRDEVAARVVARGTRLVVVDQDAYRRHRHRQPCLHLAHRRLLSRHHLGTARRRNVDGIEEDMVNRGETRDWNRMRRSLE